MCANEKQVRGVVKLIQSNSLVKIERVKNFFANLDPAHYRRLVLNVSVEVDSSDWYVCELEIHIQKIFKFKMARRDLMVKPYEYFGTLLTGATGGAAGGISSMAGAPVASAAKIADFSDELWEDFDRCVCGGLGVGGDKNELVGAA